MDRLYYLTIKTAIQIQTFHHLKKQIVKIKLIIKNNHIQKQ